MRGSEDFQVRIWQSGQAEPNEAYFLKGHLRLSREGLGPDDRRLSRAPSALILHQKSGELELWLNPKAARLPLVVPGFSFADFAPQWLLLPVLGLRRAKAAARTGVVESGPAAAQSASAWQPLLALVYRSRVGVHVLLSAAHLQSFLRSVGSALTSGDTEPQRVAAKSNAPESVASEGKGVLLLGDPILNNCGPTGAPPNTGATMMGALQAPAMPASAKLARRAVLRKTVDCQARLVPGGHYKKLRGLQRGLGNRLKTFNKDCKVKVNKTVNAQANRNIPPPPGIARISL